MRGADLDNCRTNMDGSSGCGVLEVLGSGFWVLGSGFWVTLTVTFTIKCTQGPRIAPQTIQTFGNQISSGHVSPGFVLKLTTNY